MKAIALRLYTGADTAMQRSALWLYSLCAKLAVPLLLRKLRRRARAEPGYGAAIDERFGRYTPTKAAESHKGALIWIHAVSLGETRAAAVLLKELRARVPGMRLLLTHGTATGRAEGEKLLQPGDVQVWQPWDTPDAVQRFLRHWQPRLGILMETEVWPNLTAICRDFRVPLVLANGRLNEKSHAWAMRLISLAGPAYAGLAAVWVQTESDAQRLRDVGAHIGGIFGNMKFDMVPNASQVACGRALRDTNTRPVLLLASSREGEEAMWIQALKKKRQGLLTERKQQAIRAAADAVAIPSMLAKEELPAMPVQWLIVPRHPQRFDEVHQLCKDAGLSVSRRSQWTLNLAASPPSAQPLPQVDVWLGDSLGEMDFYYGLSHVALLGGSFARLGGQNLIEAIACGCPVITGRHVFNFAEVAHLAWKAEVALRAKNMAAAVDEAWHLVHKKRRHTRMAARCLSFTTDHLGAARETAKAIVALLPQVDKIKSTQPEFTKQGSRQQRGVRSNPALMTNSAP